MAEKTVNDGANILTPSQRDFLEVVFKEEDIRLPLLFGCARKKLGMPHYPRCAVVNPCHKGLASEWMPRERFIAS